VAVTFDLFGTLIEAPKPADPGRAIATELEDRGVTVPEDWGEAYRTRHVDAPEGAEVPLPAHVAAALGSRGVEPPPNVVRRSVVATFDPEVRTRKGAVEAVEAARERGAVGILSNCSVPELVGRSLIRSAFSREEFDAIVSSVGCGWRKPHPAAFEAVAAALDRPVSELVHVGDSPGADGGIEDCGGRAILLDEATLVEVSALLETEGETDRCP
jgi:FMN phosphatase YigB (HAD superfamily)